jgi:arginine/lysine/ornithine decarboxylase
MKNSQDRAPIAEALIKNVSKRTVSFDVPGHKQGQGNPLLRSFLGQQALQYDVNSRRDLDNLIHPTGVILEAEKLAARAFKAGHAFFIVNGTSAAVQTMVMSVAKKDEKIIMPRNVHRSAINALILTGAVPVYVNPGIDLNLGISLGMSVKDIALAIEEHPDAKAVFVNNPTYYGICSHLQAIVDLAHAHKMKVIVDEAHGTHFYFNKLLPMSAMAAKADMAAVSMHKTGGSLTQSSFLLIKDDKDTNRVRKILNLTHTTSGSYLLTASLDIARKYLALNGEKLFNSVIALADYARQEINEIDGYYAFGRELINGDTIYDFDTTKLSVNTGGTGLNGIEVYDLLREKYDIQIEFGDLGNILAMISMGDSTAKVERLIGALDDIKDVYAKDSILLKTQEYIHPIVRLTPMEAFNAKQKKIKFKDSVGRISGESLMAYPPGIPVLAPGEEITSGAIDYILYAKAHGSFITGMEDDSMETIKVLEV